MKKDKSIVKGAIVTMILAFILSSALPYYKVASAAEEAKASIKLRVNGGVGGDVKAGSNVEITVDLSSLTNFYAGSVQYTYDNNLLEVSSIEVDPKIKEHHTWDAYKDVANNGNIARYGFTIMGSDDGISGSTRFVTIKGKVKKDGNLSIERKDFSFQLVQKVNGAMKNMGYELDDTKEKNIITVDDDGSGSKQKVELIGPSDASNSGESNNNASDNGTSNDGASKDGTKESSDNSQSDNNQGNKDEIVKANGNLDESSDEATSDNSNDSENASSDGKNNNGYIYLSLTLGIIVIAAGGVFVYKKKQSKNNIM